MSAHKKDNHHCRYCKKEYSKKEAKRIYGKLSNVYVGGYCSAICFTNHYTNVPLEKTINS